MHCMWLLVKHSNYFEWTHYGFYKFIVTYLNTEGPPKIASSVKAVNVFLCLLLFTIVSLH